MTTTAPPPSKRKDSAATIALAGGLFAGLAANMLVPKFSDDLRNRLEVSQSLTITVIAIGFAIGAVLTFVIARRMQHAP